MLRLLLVLCVCSVFLCGCAGPRLASVPPADYQPQTPGEPFSHARFNHVLTLTVDPDTGRVDYEYLKEHYLSDLDGYLADAAVARPDLWPAGDQKAFWINAHNAAAMRQILECWPIEDLREIDGLFGGPLDTQFLLAGKWRSLRDIHQMVDKEFQDPLMAYGLNWAVQGCPPLGYRAYDAVGLEMRLSRQRDEWLKSKSAFEPMRLPRDFNWTVNADR